MKVHEDMIKTEARKFLDFYSAKTHELPGALPPGPPPGALPLDSTPKAGPGPHPCWALRQAACGAGIARTLFPI